MSIKSDDIAIIGMSGKFPGANSVGEFWDNLCAKKESIRSLSDDELRAAGASEADLEDPAYVRAAAPLDDVDMFDAAFFRISPLEAELMDPQIRLLLQCAWETLEDAGHARRDAQQIGVFAGGGGVPTSYFSNFVNRSAQFEKVTASPTHLGNDKDFLATYLSYKLNLTGPSMTVQTACSTSLVALHQARLSLLAGECVMALAGGVSVRVPHAQGYHYKDGYIFSKSGRISTFDEGADGVVFGSGLALVLIKRLADAVRDGDHIYAVIKGSAIANDGKGKMSYAASSAKGQIACARQALKNAGVSADSIGFVESHGTGTAMGDPEEVKALSAAFKEQSERKGYCALGAVKTNVGHLEAAAGIVGLIKATLAVKHGVIPPTLHYSKPNPRIKFDNTPFYVNAEVRRWNEGKQPRRAAVNSLGVGGTNAFVIIEEYIPATQASAKVAPKSSQKASAQKKLAPTPMVAPLSAKTEAGLRAYAERLVRFLDLAAEQGRPLEIADLVYTLQTGREAMSHRAAFVVDSIDGLRAGLQRYLAGEAAVNDRSEGTEAELAASWNAGCEVDWMALYVDSRPQRMSLPTTVFAKERYWIETPSPAPARAVLHPLLHLNTSDLNEQKYSATFGGEEFFLKDHRVRTRHHAESGSRLQKVLPGVAYLEMARAAIEHAAPIHYDASVLEFRDVVWLQPITVSGEKQVNIAVVSHDSTTRDAAGQPEQRIDFEVYTQDDQIHCQGRGYFCAEAERGKIDIAALKRAMRQGRWLADDIYIAFARMGLDYGPAHRPIIAIDRDERQLLATLTLPETIAAGRDDYVLHPSLFDGALQAATTLLFEQSTIPNYPIVPFAMESLRIVAPCTGEMKVWARYAADSHPRDKSAKLDIDLLCGEGSVCVQIRGFTARRLGKQTLGALIATQVWQPAAEAAAQTAYAEQHVVLCGLPQADAARIARDCTLLTCDAPGTIADRYACLAQVCFEKLQELIRSRPQNKTLLQVVLPNTEENAVYAGLSGLMKTARLENPQIAGQVVLVDANIDTDALTALLHAERGHPHDNVIRYAHGERFTSGWEFLKEDAPSVLEREGAFKDRGVYLITGGLGGLGALFAREILTRTRQPTVILSGRASAVEIAESAEKLALLESLQAGGARVEYRRLDLGDATQTAETIAAIVAQHGQINGILHSAGAVADGFILKKSVEDFRRVLAPKVHGTWHLDLATRDLDLDFLVLFSSLTSAVGNVGQADYAAANGFMDEFAAYRNRLAADGQRRGQTVAIRWPLWEEGGMRLDAAGRDQLHETTGIYPMRTATGLRMFYRSLAFRCDQTVVMEGDLNLMQRTLGIGAAIHSLAPHSAASVQTAQASAPTHVEGSLSEPTETYLCAQLAGLLKLPAHRVDPRAPLEDYGIDSILALDLTRMLENTFGPLPKTLFFEYLTIRELAGYFAGAHAATLATLFAVPGRAAAAPVQTAAATPVQAKADGVASIRGKRRFADGMAPTATPASANALAEPIAIVGLSGRYPESRDLDAFWRNLRDGKDCIVEVPASRWDWHDYYSEDRSGKGRHFSKWGGFIEGVDEFDARFFNVSPVEAELIDPQERLFLQHAWMAIEDAGYTRAALRIPNDNDLPAQVGVYAGVMYGEYQLLGAEASLAGQRMGFASNPASIANRVSYFLNLHGPSMVVDTMCSSSLTAIHLACQDLKLGRTALGIAGGVNVTIHPNKYLMLSAGQFISGDGHCQSFGEGGDGYIPGEGVGVVVLKRLSEARRDGNPVYGVIRGSALSHGGKTNGYTVPNPQAQASAVRQALAESGVDPRHISYIEAHGTGTKLGDPIEIAALGKVFRESTQDNGFCLIGSAKSNIGHAEAAAGIAGLTKVLLQLRHRQIVPSLHSTRLNPHIDFAGSPFEVVQTLRAWERPIVDGRALPRIAGISSFGAGGANAHLIIEEYAEAQAAQETGLGIGVGLEQIVPLSARTPEQLRQKAQDLLAWLQTHGDTPLASLAYTLQIGREAMDERLALLADSTATLVDRLQRYLDGATGIDGAYAGNAKAHRDALSLLTQDPDLDATLGKWIADRKLPKLTELWAKGLDLDWHLFHARRSPLVTGLPAYPFARQRHWVDVPVAPRRTEGAAALHPLLHANTSGFDHQRYTSTFVGDEFFLADRRALTSAALLDMVRAALADALPASDAVLELREIAWTSPAPAIAGREVHLALFDRHDAGHGPRLRFELYTGNGADIAGDTVIAQGIAEYVGAALPAALDIAALRREASQSLVDVTLSPALAAGSQAFVLHPAVIDAALLAAAPRPGALPLTLGTLRLFAPCAEASLAWVRPAVVSNGMDLDLCTADGRICAQLRDVGFTPVTSQASVPQAVAAVEAHAAVSGTAALPAGHAEETTSGPVRVRFPVTRRASAGSEAIRIADGPVPPKPRNIVLVDPAQNPPAQDAAAANAASAKPSIRLDAASTTKIDRSDAIAAGPAAKIPAALDKPRGIALIAPQASRDVQTGPISLKPDNIALASLDTAAPAPAQPEDTAKLALFDHGDGVFALRLESARLTPAVVDALLGALRAVQAAPHAKALLLSGGGQRFLAGSGVEHRDAQRAGLYRAFAEFPYPIVAAARGDATGAGFLVAALCDALICADTAHYAFNDPAGGPSPEDAEAVLGARFGHAVAAEFLYSTRGATGATLKAAGWTCHVLPADGVDAAAMALAVDLAKKSQPSLRLLKAHLGRDIVAAVHAMPEAAQADAMAADADTAPAALAEIVELIGAHTQRISVEAAGERGLILSLRAGEGSAGSYIDALEAALAAADAGARGVVLRSEMPGFPPMPDIAERATSAERLRRIVAGFGRPLVAALDADADGLGWYTALLCDACVYAADGNYDAAGLLDDAALAGAAAAAFALRHGDDGAHAWLLSGGAHTGAELRDAFGVARVRTGKDVLAAALAAADALDALSLSSLRDWKRRNAEALAAAPALEHAAHADAGTTGAASAVPVELGVGNAEITAIAHPGGILEVRMADRDAKNMFSPAFTRGMQDVFAHVAASDAYKVVVLTGYDQYFSSGGTRDTLLAIHDGSAKFTDNLVFQLPLTCPLPVIAAMQGHGIGAGWAMGMYADFALFSAESRYFSPYMSYGFTPGAGSTLMFPLRIGRDLARETLLTAQDYAGADLKARGLRQPVLPREAVLPAALALAQRVARQPRARLLALKQRWAAPLRAPLDDTYARELDMHAQTFVGQADTLARIQGRFAANSAAAAASASASASASGAAPTAAVATQAAAFPASVSPSANSPSANSASANDLDPVAIAAHLRSLLANELRMEISEIGDDEQFVDLGLDSITGVTWIRRINEHYGTAIEAIKVYSYPTLAQLARHVREEAAQAAPAVAVAPIVPAAPAASNHAAPMRATSPATVTAPAASATASTPASASDLNAIAAHLRSLLANELRMDTSEIGDDEQFVDLGLDSITGVTWIRRINEHYGTSIEAIKVYSYPTLTQLARHVREEAALPEETVVAADAPIMPAQPGPEARAAVASATPYDGAVVSLASWRARYTGKSGALRTQPIAVIGMAGQFAKANDLDAFWRNIAEGRDCVEEIPAHRWDIDRYFQAGDVAPGKTYGRWMGALEEYDLFDAAFFNISPREARSMDPQQRVFLQACWHGIEHAGYDPKSLAGQRCGVFVGCSAGDYHQLSRREQLSGQGFTGAAPSILAARISYLLDLHGPSLSIDTACSSSLVAIATACDSLIGGGSDMAMAGGVNVMAGPAMQIMTAQVGMLSPQGRCFTFDERADGIANGEGVGVIVLKRLDDAERDRDRIYGVIEGWGTNQDGRTNGITAPNADSQTRLQRQVYDRFGIDPAGIQLIEAHGTGTALGDPIEVAGLKAAFKPYTQNAGYCALGSVKPNIGHCLTAAGISGVLKALLALQHRQLPPTIHFRRLNKHIALDGSPFYVNDRLRDWTVPAGAVRRAAVNSFGFSGTNGHLVIAEYAAAPRAARDAGQALLPISARTPEQLLRRVRELLVFLDARQQDGLRLDDIAYTLQTGREAMNERLAILAGSVTELKIKLRAAAEDVERAAPGEGRYRGQVSANRDTLATLSSDPDFRGIVAKWIARRELPRLADLWVKGLDLPWDGFSAVDAAPQRIGLPGYPFARERHWLDVGTDAFGDAGAGPAPGRAAALHPLLHANTSDLAGQRYDARFGDDAFHLVERARDGGTVRTLSAAACLEMARAAVAHALPDADNGHALELRGLHWAAPQAATALRIALSAQDDGSVVFDILSADESIAGDAALLFQGEAVPHALAAPPRVDLPALRARMRDAGPTPDALYARFAASGVRYGDGLRGLHTVQTNAGEWLADVRVPAPFVDSPAAFHLHPSALEAALQVGIALIAGTALAGAALAPTTIDTVLALAPCAGTLYAWARLRDAHSVDIDLCDGEGTVCVQIRGLRIDAVSAHATGEIAPAAVAMPPVATAPAATDAAGHAAAQAAAQVIALETLQHELRDSLADALFMQPGDIDVRRSFTELGLDSIIGVEWVKAINRRYGSELSATRVYDYPSVADLAAHLHARLLAAAPVAVSAPAVAAAPLTTAAALPKPSAAAPASAPTTAQVIALETLQHELRDSLADALFMQPGDIDVRRSFTELGLDSIIGVEWVKTINRRYGSAISATRVYDYPSVADLAAYLHAQLVAAAPVVASAPVAAAAPAASIAVAMSAPTVASAPAAQAIALETLQHELRESLADALFMQPGDIDVRRSFTELGLDSIIGVEWVKAINRRYGSELSATRVYDYPSVADLAGYLHAQLVAAMPVAAAAPVVAPTVVAAAAMAPVAAMPAPRARAGRGTRFGGGIRFAPKFGQRYKSLYFHASDASGDLETEGEFSVRLSLSPDTNISLREHVVFGEHLLPTDAYIELVYAAYRSYFAPDDVRLERIALANPLLGTKGRETRVQISFRRSGDGLQCFVRSSRSGDFDDAVLHMQGMVVPGAGLPAAVADGDFAVERSLAAGDIPTNAGTYYAPLRSLRLGETRALGEIAIAAHDFAFVANPLALYGGLCTAINFAAHLSARHFGASDDQFLPYRIGTVAVHGALDGREYLCRAEARSIERDAIEFAFVLVEANGSGRIAATVDGLVLRRVPAQTIRQQALQAASLPAAPAPRSAGAPAREAAVAIIGMSCRYPMSETVDAFWDNLRDGRDCVSVIPATRWGGAEDWYHPDPRHPHTSYSKWAGLLDDIDAFDALFFGISPVEAESIDPQQRVFLEECWKTIESAGYAPGALSGQACGVYVGCAMGDYARVLADEGQDTLGAAFMGTSTAILSARISYFLNLRGAALAIDTACSSSLVAVHLACESIRSGENRLALAGGINLLTTPLGHILTSQVGMPSRDGRCATFDASANGIVFSEGCGVLLLKALADAERDGDDILGVIRGSGTNQDGKTNGITAPSARAQEQLLRQIYDKFDIDPARISYVEAHGTATPLGDPIEVDALTAVFGSAEGTHMRCALGSVKSNIGHAGFAAGVAGIVKVLLCIKHRTLVPSIHYYTPNPHIDFERSPFHVNTRTRAWDSDTARMATVSSFGFSGTNAHLVIEEHLPTAEAARALPAPVGPVAIPLSARADEQLFEQARDLLAFLRRSERPLDLARVACTLQIGREAMPHRLAVIAESQAQLEERLQRIVDGETRVDGVYRGIAGRDDTLAALTGDADMRRVIDGWIAQKHLPKVLDLWVRGLALDWSKLHTGAAPRRMALPTYPFARERCWAEGGARRASATPVLHPLLHRNVSDLGQQRYASVFAGTEFFLADHRVNGRPVLPAVAYLEMARAALHDALPPADAHADAPLALELRHIVWAQPIVVEDDARVGISIFADGADRLEFEVTRQVGDGREADESLHCQGSAAVVASAVPEPLDLAALRARMHRGRSGGDALYPQFAAMGLGYGPAFQGVIALERGDDEVLVELALPASARSEGFVLHPSIADSALQGSIALIDTGAPGRPALPFALESLRVHAPCEARMFAWVRYAPGGRGAGLIKVDIDLCAADGRICAAMRGFSSRPLDTGTAAQSLVDGAFDEAHYLSVIDDVLSRRLSADEAVELG